jgi:outer membrane biosynthesis protein TonB
MNNIAAKINPLMSKKWMMPAFGLAVFSAGCGGNQQTKETVVVTDTVVKTETVVVPAAIDSAAIVAYYEAAHAKAKGTHQEKHTVHAETKKKVRVDSHTPVEHHDALTLETPAATTSAPASADPAAPAQPAVIVLHDTETFYYRPDEKASFPGGEQAFDKYIIQNIKYPSEAVRLGVTGTVHAIMYLDETGKVSKVDFAGKEIGYGLEAETRRLLMNAPRWNPAKHNGVAVKSKFALPVTFELNG